MKKIRMILLISVMLIGFVFIMQIRHQNLSSITEESIVLENQFIETEVTREEAISIIASRKNMRMLKLLSYLIPLIVAIR